MCIEGCEPPELQDRLVYCYPARLASPSPPQPRVELHFENEVACLRYKGEMVKINRGHFSKLVSYTAGTTTTTTTTTTTAIPCYINI